MEDQVSYSSRPTSKPSPPEHQCIIGLHPSSLFLGRRPCIVSRRCFFIRAALALCCIVNLYTSTSCCSSTNAWCRHSMDSCAIQQLSRVDSRSLFRFLVIRLHRKLVVRITLANIFLLCRLWLYQEVNSEKNSWWAAIYSSRILKKT